MRTFVIDDIPGAFLTTIDIGGGVGLVTFAFVPDNVRLQGVMTGMLREAYPHYSFLRVWVSHSLQYLIPFLLREGFERTASHSNSRTLFERRCNYAQAQSDQVM